MHSQKGIVARPLMFAFVLIACQVFTLCLSGGHVNLVYGDETPKAEGAHFRRAGVVPMALVEKAANFYASERWPGCRPIAMTPYYALDGSINAYAAQFSKGALGPKTGSELSDRVAVLEEAEKALRNAAPDIKKGANLSESRAASAETEGGDFYVEIEAGKEGGQGFARAEVAPGAVEKGRSKRRQVEQETKAVRAWREKVRSAANASVLADEIGTVIIAARYDIYPLLERFDGVAPHVKHASKAIQLSGAQQNQQAAIGKSYYLGPLAVFHDVRIGTRGADKGEIILVDALKGRMLDRKRALDAGAGRLPPAPEGKCSVSSREFWERIEKDGVPPRTDAGDKAGRGSDTIPGVPYYHQDDYGAASCGPTASAQAVAYWDDNGYGNLVDNGSSTTGHENELVYCLMRAEDYDPGVGTYGNMIEPGIEAVCNDNAYGNNLNFNVISDYSVSWSDDIKAEINADRPFVYFNWNGGQYPYWAHFTTGTGYNDDSGHLLYVHYNYAPDSPYELNWDNISSSNEAVYKVNPNATPTFDCVWSEDFEGTFPGSWSAGGNGASAGYWDDCSYRSHNITTNPYPPGGTTSWSGYCVDSHVSPPGPYPNNIRGWMIYGPFSTLGRTNGEISAYIWRYILDGSTDDDYVALFASVNGTNFYGTAWWGDHRSWNRCALDLTDVYTLGNIMNRSQVWVAVWFCSDGSSTAEGAYADDITIRLSGSGAQDDNYEPNDTRQEAYDLSACEQTWLSAVDGSGIQANDDWYEISVSSGYERVLADCRFTHAAGDINIGLYNSSGGQVAASNSTTDNEYIDFTVAAPGTYYLLVSGDDTSNTYDLWWDDVQSSGWLIIDNADPGFTVESGAVWATSTAMGGYYRDSYAFRAPGSGSNVVRWTPYLPAGYHTVCARWTAGSNRARKVTYSVTHAGGTSNVTVDQRTNGGKWIPLGCFQFGEGTDGYVETSDAPTGYVIADAIMWRPAEDSTIVDNLDGGFDEVSGTWPTGSATGGYYATNYAYHAAGTGHVARWMPDLPSTGSYAVYARWTSGRNRSRKIVYTVNYDGGGKTVTVNQKAFGGQWVLLGRFPFQAGEAGNVELSSSPLGCVIADAIMWQYCDAAALIVDNTDPEFTEQSGTWPTSSHSGGYYGTNYAYHQSGSGSSTVLWTPDIPSSVDYMLYARWTAASNRSIGARYTVHYNGGTATVTVGHNKKGGLWWPLGCFPFAAGTGGYVELSDRPDGMVVADALMWAPQDAGLIVDNVDGGFSVVSGIWPTSSGTAGYYGTNYAYHVTGSAASKVRWTPDIAGAGAYSVYARWTSHKKRSRKATYTVHHADGENTLTVNQRGFGGQWVDLGDFGFNVGTAGWVELSASPDGTVVADAIMWVAPQIVAPSPPARAQSAASPDSNSVPVAVATCLTDKPVVGSPVLLSAADSYDPDDGPEPLTYQWTQVSGPEVKLGDATAAEPAFTPTLAGLYVFELQVSDGADHGGGQLAVVVTD